MEGVSMSTEVRTRRITATLRSGEKLRIPAWEVEGQKDGPTLLLFAAQHGNEVQGSEVIRRFVEMASKKAVRGKVFAVPFANPAALRIRRPHISLKPEQPYAQDRGHNMNRTWPGNRNGNDTARVSYAIYQAFGEQSTHVFDLHCWQKYAAPAVLIRDEARLREMAIKLGHRFVTVCGPYDRLISGLFNATGRLGVTYEFAGQYVVFEHEVKTGLRLVTNFAKMIGLLPGPLQKGDDPVIFSDRAERIEVNAPNSGLFITRDHKLCQPVKKGELLGHILSETSLSCREIVSPAAGYLQVYGASRADCDVTIWGHHPYVSRGERLATITKPTAR